MDCPKCKGNGEIDYRNNPSSLGDDSSSKIVMCEYCSGTGYLEAADHE